MGDFDGGFCDLEMFGEELNEGVVSLAVVRFGAEIDRERVVGDLDDFFLARAGLDGDLVFHIYII